LICKQDEKTFLLQDTVVGTNRSYTFDTGFAYFSFTVQINPKGGSASVFVSLDGVEWKEWDTGAVSAMDIDVCVPVRFIRVTNTTSTSTAVTIWGCR